MPAVNLEKQFRFALASTLTAVAKEAQKEVVKAIDNRQGGAFTVRNNWTAQSNKFGVKVQPATKTDLSATVGTAADWLIPHEEGEDKTPTKGKHIAVPTKRVRRTKRDIISRAQRPRNLKRSFIVLRKDGDLWLYMRSTKKRYPIVAMYKLTGRARIRITPPLMSLW